MNKNLLFIQQQHIFDKINLPYRILFNKFLVKNFERYFLSDKISPEYKDFYLLPIVKHNHRLKSFYSLCNQFREEFFEFLKLDFSDIMG
jgi:hypothetical protein